MRWNSWVTYALFAALVTVGAKLWTPVPVEGEVTDFLRSVPGGGLWSAFNGFVESKWAFAAAVLAVTFALYVFFQPRDVVLPLAGLAGGMMIGWVIQPFVERPRPGLIGMVTLGGFPSGSAMLYASWLGAVALVCMRRVRSDGVRKVAVALLAVFIVLGGIARVASGAHWFLDVAGAWLWSAAWLVWLDRATRGVSA